MITSKVQHCCSWTAPASCAVSCPELLSRLMFYISWICQQRRRPVPEICVSLKGNLQDWSSPHRALCAGRSVLGTQAELTLSIYGHSASLTTDEHRCFYTNVVTFSSFMPAGSCELWLFLCDARFNSQTHNWWLFFTGPMFNQHLRFCLVQNRTPLSSRTRF